MATAIAHVAGISTRQKMETTEKNALTSSKRFVIKEKGYKGGEMECQRFKSFTNHI
jgi:hypothetical protein